MLPKLHAKVDHTHSAQPVAHHELFLSLSRATDLWDRKRGFFLLKKWNQRSGTIEFEVDQRI
jgi:hypothetical protein